MGGGREAHVLSCSRALSARARAVGMIVARARALGAGAGPTRLFRGGQPKASDVRLFFDSPENGDKPKAIQTFTEPLF